MKIPYRLRQFLLRFGIIALIVAVVAGLVFFCWFTWLERYVIYTRDKGAVIDMSMSPHVADGEPAKPNNTDGSVSIYYNEGENTINVSKELTQMVGYYATAEDLEKSVDDVLAQANALPTGTPIMIDVKSPKGNFFYSTSVSSHLNPDLDIEKMDQLIDHLDKKGMYLIARLPSLRDYYFGLEKTSNGLFVASGSHLWADDDYCYWLNPSSEGTVTYLSQIVTELKSRGFDEVVFDEFCFPDTDNLKFEGDREEAIKNAAKILVASCASENFAVSFVGKADFPLPEGRCRLYITDGVAAQADSIAQQTGLENPAINLVFLTEIHDTRFDTYSVLRPLEAAH